MWGMRLAQMVFAFSKRIQWIALLQVAQGLLDSSQGEDCASSDQRRDQAGVVWLAKGNGARYRECRGVASNASARRTMEVEVFYDISARK